MNKQADSAFILDDIFSASAIEGFDCLFLAF